MVGLGRFELPTSPLSGVRSNQLSYRPRLHGELAGGADRDRTGDPLLAKQVLSQLSYSPIDTREIESGYVDQWWVWEDSNHRPRPYQGRALTT